MAIWSLPVVLIKESMSGTRAPLKRKRSTLATMERYGRWHFRPTAKRSPPPAKMGLLKCGNSGSDWFLGGDDRSGPACNRGKYFTNALGDRVPPHALK